MNVFTHHKSHYIWLEITPPVTFEVTAQLEDGSLTGEATTTILMSEFGVGLISILGFLETEDEVLLKFNFMRKKPEYGLGR
jgi:hypothetical protein